MESKHPYQVVGAIVVAMSLCFAAGVVGTSGKNTADSVKAENLVAELLSVPAEYFPSRYQNQATEIEPLPPQS